MNIHIQSKPDLKQRLKLMWHKLKPTPFMIVRFSFVTFHVTEFNLYIIFDLITDIIYIFSMNNYVGDTGKVAVLHY